MLIKEARKIIYLENTIREKNLIINFSNTKIQCAYYMNSYIYLTTSDNCVQRLIINVIITSSKYNLS